MSTLRTLQDLESRGGICACGKVHSSGLDAVYIGKGAVTMLPVLCKRYGAKHPFILADKNTFAVAGEAVCAQLSECGLPFSSYLFEEDHVEPDEQAVGSAVMHYDYTCDLLITIGSGVLNDIGKILSSMTKTRYIVVGTAPSMDGYASASSSMARDGLKISLNTRCPDAIIGDIDFVKTAPLRMLQSGLGDMLAKYVSICEWRISHLINGEYYCKNVAALVKEALQRCVDNAQGLLNRDDDAVQAVMEGLVISGIAMNYAGISRPASGVEHYFSHVWDMRALEFGTPADTHGIQCGIATLSAAKLYEQIRTLTPDKEKATAYAQSFDLPAWHATLRQFLGKSAEAMIRLEQKEQKYSVQKHAARFAVIEQHWPEILRIIDEEMPSSAQIEQILTAIGAPKTPQDIGIEAEILPRTFMATRDIRDKYVLSRLAWDLGVTDELTVE